STSEQIQITGKGADPLTLTGPGVVNLSPLTTGPYAGITLWQDRSSSVPMQIEGNGLFTIAGTFYAAGAMLSVAGNGGTRMDESGLIKAGSQIGSQYITKDLSITGNGNVYLGYRGQMSHGRTLGLVE